MKVLQVVKTSSGANWAFEQALRLKQYGLEVVTVMPDDSGRVAQKYKENGMRLVLADFSLPVTRPWKFFSRRKLIRGIIEAEKPDIVHFHFVTNIVMARLALKKNKTPRIFQVPGPLHLEGKLFRMLDIKTARANDYWVGTCNKTNEIYLSSGVSENNVYLSYYGGYGGDTCDMYPNENDILHTTFNIDKSKKTVGMVSYIYKPKWYAKQKRGIKGHEDFIDAMSIVREAHKDAVGVIVGGPWGNSQKYFDKIKKYAKEKCGDGIIFTGYRTDIKDIYCELDVVVHPSHSENLGGAAESLAGKRPTISTNVGGFPDIVIDGETGYTVPPKNPCELSRAIIKMLDDEENAKIMAQRGQDLVRNLLDINSTAEKMKEIYEDILRKESQK